MARVPQFRRTWKKHRPLWPVIVLALVATVVIIASGRSPRNDVGLAAEGVVTASSTAFGFSPRDVVTSGSADAPGAPWQSAGETAGAWIQLDWPEAHTLRKIILVRNPIEEPGVTSGFLSFGDGSYVQVQLSPISRVTVIPVSSRSVGRLRFTASQVGVGAHNVSIAEIIVSAQPSNDDVVVDPAPDGNEAPTAVASTVGNAPASDPLAIKDGSGAPGAAGIGADWTVAAPVGAGVRLQWSHPRELSSVQLVGSGPPGATIAGATLTFADGSRLPVGAVLADPARPTTVSFMPRVTTSLLVTVDKLDGTGALSLGELRAYRSGATPVRTRSDASPDSPMTLTGPCSTPAPRPAAGLVVGCPVTGAVVQDTARFQIAAAAGYTDVTATVWPSDEAAKATTPVAAALSSDGTAELTTNLAHLPPGPLTVELAAVGPKRPTSTVFFQLYREGSVGAVAIPSSTGAGGRTLTYQEEFDRPITLSRTGLGADYAGAKPTYDGAQNFGDAPFPEDSSGFANVGVVDNRYLQLGLEPTSGGAGTQVGGLLASARQGGSGFSAQYAYFEARMLVPAAPGTWPAFWMLPSDNLIAPTPVVAEVDAVELYGHEPTGACESTHQFKDGKDGGVARCGPRFPTARSALAWHTYGVSILPTTITFYIDGKVVASAPQVEGGAAPMLFLVDLALGGGWPADLQAVQNRAYLYVDYVRVYV